MITKFKQKLKIFRVIWKTKIARQNGAKFGGKE